MFKLLLLFAGFLGAIAPPPACSATGGQADVLHVKVKRKLEGSNLMVDFRTSLIEKALTASGHKYVIEDCTIPKYPTSDARYAVLIENGEACDLLVTASGARFTERLLLVPVPIYLGGGGYRVFLANRATVGRMSEIDNLSALKRARIGSGTFWSDSDIMADNGLTVIRADYQNLFPMLEAGRFDLLSRSIYEVGGEKERIAGFSHIVVEPRLLLHYPGDLFFYVSRARPDLQHALTVGMTRLYCNGGLRRHIDQHPSTKDVQAGLHIKDRIVIELANHHLKEDEARAIANFPPSSAAQKSSKVCGAAN